ncbi:MAG: putative lipoprotein YmbA [Flavobacteriales bacterium]|jgi:uncharacterized lipoprotein YmbA
MKTVTIFLCLALFFSCASEPLNVRYYLLHTPENTVPDTSDKTKPIVVLQLLDIADYLRQSSLVMQIDEHELHYSRQDVWAEKLQSSFYKALLQDLNATDHRDYVASYSPIAKDAMAAITIKLEHFHATDSSTVVSSGQYWLSENAPQTSKNQHIMTSTHSFFFESPLKRDGYAHAVEQLRTLLERLAKQIEKDIAVMPNN